MRTRCVPARMLPPHWEGRLIRPFGIWVSNGWYLGGPEPEHVIVGGWHLTRRGAVRAVTDRIWMAERQPWTWKTDYEEPPAP